MTVGLVRYRAGNLLSVRRAVAHLGYTAVDISSEADLAGVDVLVLPGVGHFGHAAADLQRVGLWEPIQQWLRHEHPFLGICVGFQLLFASSEEAPTVAGLGMFDTSVNHYGGMMPQRQKIPQIGWNCVTPDAQFIGMNSADYFYFVNSFCAPSATLNGQLGVATSEYGGAKYVAAVQNEWLLATQFHLEKSGEAGLSLMQSFLKRVASPTMTKQ